MHSQEVAKFASMRNTGAQKTNQTAGERAATLKQAPLAYWTLEVIALGKQNAGRRSQKVTSSLWRLETSIWGHSPFLLLLSFQAHSWDLCRVRKLANLCRHASLQWSEQRMVGPEEGSGNCRRKVSCKKVRSLKIRDFYKIFLHWKFCVFMQCVLIIFHPSLLCSNSPLCPIIFPPNFMPSCISILLL